MENLWEIFEDRLIWKFMKFQEDFARNPAGKAAGIYPENVQRVAAHNLKI